MKAVCLTVVTDKKEGGPTSWGEDGGPSKRWKEGTRGRGKIQGEAGLGGGNKY